MLSLSEDNQSDVIEAFVSTYHNIRKAFSKFYWRAF